MKAAIIHQPGPPESIEYVDLPKPEATGRQVLVRVEAVSVNPIDTYVRAGAVAAKLPDPFVIGCDVAGEVEAVGPEVTRFRPGMRVWGSNQGVLGRQGTFAEYRAIDEEWLYECPASVAFNDAAALSLTAITARLGLVDHARLRSGETLFVTGGSGGVGSCVVQMGKALGARVITTAGSEEKADFCRQIGADDVIQYRQESIPDRLKTLAPDGVNVWWEVTAQANFAEAFPRLAKRGRMVVMAGRAARPIFPMGDFYPKDLSVFGFAMYNASPEEQQRAADDINRWMESGQLKASIGKILPLSEAAAAHKLQEDNTLRNAGTLQGKIVLNP